MPVIHELKKLVARQASTWDLIVIQNLVAKVKGLAASAAGLSATLEYWFYIHFKWNIKFVSSFVTTS